MVIVRLLDGTEYNTKIKFKVEPFVKLSFQERYPNYNPSVNYRDKHLEWLNKKTGFCPVWAYSLCGKFDSYKNYIAQLYYGVDASVKSNESAFLYYRDDVHAYKKRKDKSVDEEAYETFGLTAPKKKTAYPDKWFITFNWAPNAHTLKDWVKKVETGVMRLFMKEWVLEARGCFEYHGKTKNHAHFMCVLKIDQNVNTISEVGKFRKVIKESSLAYKLEGQYINFQPFEERHDDYVDLIKSDSKQEALDKDRMWRDKMELRHHYNKTDYMKDY